MGRRTDEDFLALPLSCSSPCKEAATSAYPVCASRVVSLCSRLSPDCRNTDVTEIPSALAFEEP